ncbi:MAG: hypothetical protein K2L10_04105 [Ruminococcus sp.]|nr:hypothetical protein [Ruminococcus sp.]
MFSIKKLISFFTVISLLTSYSPIHSYADDTETTDLYALASSLGADTDYLKVVNYKHDDEHPVKMDSFRDYLWKCSVIEACYTPVETFSAMVSDGSCMGISLLEIISHNGVIKPSDIQAGAENLSEISYNDDVDSIITSYQCLQGHTEFDYYERFIMTNTSYDEQIDNLIETAENNMNDDRYFLVIVRSNGLYHAVCGMGIADGNWEWNGKKYDKCILTLDSNITDTNGNPRGFHKNACIYINSETKDSYIPSYKIGTEDDISFISIDDDTLLNYKGKFNTSETINTDISGIKQISRNTSENTKLYTVSDDGNMTSFDDNYFSDYVGKTNFVKADSVHIDLDNEKVDYPNFRYINPNRWIDIEFLDDYMAYEDGYNADVYISDNNVYMKCNEGNIEEIGLQIRMNEGTYGCSPFFWWNIDIYDLSDDVNVEVRDNGILLKSNGTVKADLTPYCYQLDENGHFKFTSNDYYMDVENVSSQYTRASIESDNNVFISIENQEIMYYIDKNGDDVYDDRVEKGDVNCDGFINAVDATLVLQKYAGNSTGSLEYIGVGHALGDYNGDGLVDAIDATQILRKYAELSTGK